MIHNIACRHSPATLRNVFTCLIHLLPCSVCRDNFENEIRDFCRKLDNGEKVCARMAAFELHNKVRLRLQKPVQDLSILNQYDGSVDVSSIDCIKCQLVPLTDYRQIGHRHPDAMSEIEIFKLRMFYMYITKILRDPSSARGT